MSDTEMTIRAIKNGILYHLIPRKIISLDFPAKFVDDNVHWLNTTDRTIEFRPNENLWELGPKDWKVFFEHEVDLLLAKAYLESTPYSLLDVRSRLSQQVYRIFQPIETKGFIELTFNDDDGQTEVKWTRYHLRFTVVRGSLHSRELNAIVDHDQYLRTLIGLRNRLVLRSADEHNGITKRSVFVPYGHCLLERSSHHVSLNIHLPKNRERIMYANYQVNTT